MENKFSYIQSLQVNDCYTYQNILIPIYEGDSMRNLIITGENGSGKTTILNRLNHVITQLSKGTNIDLQIRNLRMNLETKPKNQRYENWQNQLKQFDDVRPIFQITSSQLIPGAFPTDQLTSKTFIYSYYHSLRQTNLGKVDTVTSQTELFRYLNSDDAQRDFTSNFKQFLVNLKVFQAFDMLDEKQESVLRTENFFNNFENILKDIFQSNKLELKFVKEQFEFYIVLPDKREITFNQLADGFSALLSIVLDLILRIEVLRENNKDYSLNPPGIALIDEPETHLHLEMQYQIMPLLTKLFPSIQFIVATHSPAILSSIKEATIFDLSEKLSVTDNYVGKSYSELMVSHFGLRNEFSNEVDNLLNKIKNIFKKDQDKAKRIQKLHTLLKENNDILSPSLRIHIESLIAEEESKNHD